MFLWKIPRFMWVKLEHPHYLIRDGGILYFDEISALEIQEINK